MFLWCSEEAATCEWKSVIALMMISWIFLGFFHTSLLLHTFPSSSREHRSPLRLCGCIVLCQSEFTSSEADADATFPADVFSPSCSCKGEEGVSMRVEILLMELHYRNFLFFFTHAEIYVCKGIWRRRRW